MAESFMFLASYCAVRGCPVPSLTTYIILTQELIHRMYKFTSTTNSPKLRGTHRQAESPLFLVSFPFPFLFPSHFLSPAFAVARHDNVLATFWPKIYSPDRFLCV